MCVVSNIGDMGRQMWPAPLTPLTPYTPMVPMTNPSPYMPQSLPPPLPYNGPTKEQFEEFLKMMRAAKRFDTLMGLKDCEAAEKIEWLKAIAAHLGIDVSDLTK